MKMESGHLPRTKNPSFGSFFIAVDEWVEAILWKWKSTYYDYFRFDYLVRKMQWCECSKAESDGHAKKKSLWMCENLRYTRCMFP